MIIGASLLSSTKKNRRPLRAGGFSLAETDLSGLPPASYYSSTMLKAMLSLATALPLSRSYVLTSR